jgi:hypothetical protein
MLCRHEDMAPMMGVNVRPFRDKFKDSVDQIKRSMLNYVKSLQVASGEREMDEAEDEDVVPQITMTEAGLPIVPDPTAWRGQLKKTMEPLLRMYLGQHYSMCRSYAVPC